MDFLDLLNGNNYGIFNRSVARELGLNTAIILSEFIDKYQYYHKQNSLIQINGQEGDWFYLTAESLEERTTLSEKSQRASINQLISLGFIKKITYSLPAKRYFQLNLTKLFEFFNFKINITRTAKRPNLEYTEGQTVPAKRPAIEPNKEPYEKPKEEESASPPPLASPQSSADASALSKFLFEKIKERNPKFKEPDWKLWNKKFELLLRVDKREKSDVENLINWISTNSFWSSVCLSPYNLRKNFDKIVMSKQHEEETNLIDENRRYALAAKEAFPHRLKDLTVNSRYAMNLPMGKEVSLKLPKEQFKNAFIQMFGGKYEPNKSNE